MNESFKQNRAAQDKDIGYSDDQADHWKDVRFFFPTYNVKYKLIIDLSSSRFPVPRSSDGRPRLRIVPACSLAACSHKAISLPSSPHEFSSQMSNRVVGASTLLASEDMVSAWNAS